MTPCVVWEGSLRNGYGEMRVGDRMYYVHRLAWTDATGLIPIELDHLCRNPPCYNVAHLEDVGHQENMLRGTSPVAGNARKTHCPRGHPYDRTDRRGYRYCRRCQTQWQIEHDRRTGRKR